MIFIKTCLVGHVGVFLLTRKCCERTGGRFPSLGDDLQSPVFCHPAAWPPASIHTGRLSTSTVGLRSPRAISSGCRALPSSDLCHLLQPLLCSTQGCQLLTRARTLGCLFADTAPAPNTVPDIYLTLFWGTLPESVRTASSELGLALFLCNEH